MVTVRQKAEKKGTAVSGTGKKAGAKTDSKSGMSESERGIVLAFFREECAGETNAALATALASGDGERVWTCYRDILEKRLIELDIKSLIPLLGLGRDVTRFGQGTVFLAEHVEFCQRSLEMELEILVSDPLDWIRRYRQTVSFCKDNLGRFEPTEHPIASLFLDGEMPLLFGLLYREFTCFRDLVGQGQSFIRESLDFLPDAQGFFSGQNFYKTRSLLASWTRSLRIAERGGITLLTASLLRRFEWVFLQFMRWSRPNGQEVFSALEPGVTSVQVRAFLTLLDNAIPFDEDLHDQTAGAQAFQPLSRQRLAGPGPYRNLESASRDGIVTMPSSCSDDSTLAVLKSGWAPESVSLYLNTCCEEKSTSSKTGSNNNSSLQTELLYNESILWSGLCETTIRIAGKKLAALGPWSLLCEEIQSDYTCLEWGLPLSGGWRLERSFLLIPNDHLLLMSDSILTDENYPESERVTGNINSQITFPWATGTLRSGNDLATDGETGLSDNFRETASGARELYYFAPSNNRVRKPLPAARLIPLGQSEWLDDRSRGEFTVRNGKLTWTSKATAARNLYLPLLFDWDTNRAKQPCTWRQLTVGENLEAVPDEVAVAFRYQAGRDQYLIYRSLAYRANRSFLGHHSGCEFLFASFDKTSGVTPLVTVEPVEP